MEQRQQRSTGLRAHRAAGKTTSFSEAEWNAHTARTKRWRSTSAARAPAVRPPPARSAAASAANASSAERMAACRCVMCCAPLSCCHRCNVVKHLAVHPYCQRGVHVGAGKLASCWSCRLVSCSRSPVC